MRYLLAAIVMCCAATSYAQPPLIIEPDVSSHEVTVVNELGKHVRLKLMGYRPDAHFLSDMYPNGSTTQQFYAGERVVCVWDQQQRLILAARVNVNQPGTLRLRMPAAPVAAQTESYSVESALPMIQLEN